ncbi:MAG: HTTM domain-containing protein [Candidatus Omnitrophota bacterium]
MLSVYNQWKSRLYEPVDSSTLGTFRFLFGFLLIIQSFCIFNEPFIQSNFIQNRYHFPHPLFEWLHLSRLSGTGIHCLFLLMGISAVGICTGLWYRMSTLIYLATFTYVFLFEKALYNDHYYLIILVCGLFCFMDADRWPALPTFRKTKETRRFIPYWFIWVLKFQFLVVYFYGGLSKLNTDWLCYAEPVYRIIATKTLFGFSLNHYIPAYLISYAGILVDLGMPFLLLSRYTRRLGFSLAVFFNITNVWLFEGDIGIFPYLMIASLVLFIKPSAPRILSEKYLREKSSGHRPIEMPPDRSYRNRRVVTSILIVYVIFQLIFPLRHWLYNGDVRWNFEGARYSWFLKLNAKDVRLHVYVLDPVTNNKIIIDHTSNLTVNQLWMDNIPDMFFQWVQLLKIELDKIEIKNPRIYIQSAASLNRRPFQPYLDPNLDFSEAEFSIYRHSPWIVPLDKHLKPQR